jgi:hypothetical protein
VVDHLARHARRIVECNDLSELPEGIAAGMLQLTDGAMPKSVDAEAALQIGRWIQDNRDYLQHERESARRGSKGTRPWEVPRFEREQPGGPDDQRWGGVSTRHALRSHSYSTENFRSVTGTGCVVVSENAPHAPELGGVNDVAVMPAQSAFLGTTKARNSAIFP